MRGSKRYRSGAWRLVVFTGWDPATGKRRNLYETVHGPENRVGAKAADARLAELIAAVESGATPAPTAGPSGPTVAQLADRWQRANKPRIDERTGTCSGWSPKTAKTHADNFRLYLLPGLGRRRASSVSGADLDDLYAHLADERELSLALVNRCHSQVRAMFNWALRKKLVDHNPALSADPVKLKKADLAIPSMADVRAVQGVAPPAFAAYVQVAAPSALAREAWSPSGSNTSTWATDGSRSHEPSPKAWTVKSRRAPRPTVRTSSPWARPRAPYLSSISLEPPIEPKLRVWHSTAMPSSSLTTEAVRTGTFPGRPTPGSGTP